MKVASSYLIKRPYNSGWRWYGQIKYKDANGRWHDIRRALTDEDGNPIPTDPDEVEVAEDGTQTRVRTTRNIRKANAALDAWKKSMEGTPLGGRTKVPEYVDGYLDMREGTVEKSTMRKYREYARIVSGGFRNVQMRDLTVKKVEDWVQGMTKRGFRRETVRTAYSLLHTVCLYAVSHGDLATDPCKRGTLKTYGPAKQPGETRPNALDVAGVARANAMLDATKNDRLRIGARLALVCGLRASECCGLRWRDVDLDALTITVHKAIGRAHGGTYEKDPKSDKSDRTVPMPASLAAELSAWREVQEAEHTVAARGQRHKVPKFYECRVIGYADGSALTPHALGNAWSRLAAKGDANGPLTGTENKRCTMHDLRHSFATHEILCGADVRTVADLMGHDDPSVTLRRYASTNREAMRAAIERAATVLSAGSSWASPSDADSDQWDTMA